MRREQLATLNQAVRDIRDKLYRERTNHSLTDISHEIDEAVLQDIATHPDYIAAQDALIAAQDQ